LLPNLRNYLRKKAKRKARKERRLK